MVHSSFIDHCTDSNFSVESGLPVIPCVQLYSGTSSVTHRPYLYLEAPSIMNVSYLKMGLSQDDGKREVQFF